MYKFLMTLIILKAAVIPLKCYVASGGESSLGLYTNVNRKSGFFGGNRAAVTAERCIITGHVQLLHRGQGVIFKLLLYRFCQL